MTRSAVEQDKRVVPSATYCCTAELDDPFATDEEARAHWPGFSQLIAVLCFRLLLLVVLFGNMLVRTLCEQ